MKLRLSMLALFVLFVAVPPASAQFIDPGTGQPSTRPGTIPDPGNGTRGSNRVVTTALLVRTDGTPIGKVKTGTVQVGTQVHQGLRLTATGLAPNTEYALVIDGVLVGTAATDASGILRMRFLTPSNGRAPVLPQSVLPIAVARTASLYQTSTQQLVASGQFTIKGKQ